ncbi:MAG: hypothetical protein JWO70_440 [Betaproteobacteria bacterium]|nr:hypothetical protein [Betaproteobacteria bacterium]
MLRKGSPFETSTQCGALRVALSTLLCAGIALMSACTSIGTGSGSVAPGGAPVNFSWKSTNGGTSGTMSATLDDGKTYSGSYLQITHQVSTQGFEWDRGWSAWGAGWNDWDGWGPFPMDAFATEYSDRVTATLQDADGQRMRCTFHLNTPVDGMTGGGQGKCQLRNGRTVDAVFPRGSTRLGTT